MTTHFKLFLSLAVTFSIFACSQKKEVAGGYIDETETALSGRLIGPHGEPIAFQKVTVFKDFRSGIGTLFDSVGISTTTDKDGHFQLETLSPGQWFLSAITADSLGIMQPIQLDLQDNRLDTLSPLGILVIKSIPGSLSQKFFIPQLGRIIDLENLDSVCLPIPAGSYELFPMENQTPIIADSLPSITVLSGQMASIQLEAPPILLWSALANWTFQNALAPWSDTSGFNHGANVEFGAPIRSVQGELVLDGQSGLRIALTSALAPVDFMVRGSLQSAVSPVPVQNLICSESALPESDSWCLRLRNQDSLVFYFRDGQTSEDSLVAFLEPEVLQEFRAEVYHGTARLWVAGILLTSKNTLAMDFSDLSEDFTFGYRSASPASDRLFSGIIDYLSINGITPPIESNN
jgi:hypothetical protein